MSMWDGGQEKNGCPPDMNFKITRIIHENNQFRYQFNTKKYNSVIRWYPHLIIVKKYMCTWSYPSNSVKCTQYNTEYCGLSTLDIPDNDPTHIAQAKAVMHKYIIDRGAYQKYG